MGVEEEAGVLGAVFLSLQCRGAGARLHVSGCVCPATGAGWCQHAGQPGPVHGLTSAGHQPDWSVRCAGASWAGRRGVLLQGLPLGSSGRHPQGQLVSPV